MATEKRSGYDRRADPNAAREIIAFRVDGQEFAIDVINVR